MEAREVRGPAHIRQGSLGSFGCVPETTPRTKKSSTSAARSPSPGTQPRLDPTRHSMVIAIHPSLQRPSRCLPLSSGDIIPHPFRARKSQLHVFSYRERRLKPQTVAGLKLRQTYAFYFDFSKNKTLPRRAKWTQAYQVRSKNSDFHPLPLAQQAQPQPFSASRSASRQVESNGFSSVKASSVSCACMRQVQKKKGHEPCG
jgi:hypothetical protein